MQWCGTNGDGPLHIASRANKPGIVAWLLSQPPAEDVLELRNARGETPLLTATRLCRGCVAMRLIEALADPAATDFDGESAEALDLDGLLREAERDEACRQAAKEDRLLAAVMAARKQREEAEWRRRLFEMLEDEDFSHFESHQDLEGRDKGSRSDSWMDDIAEEAEARRFANRQSMSTVMAAAAPAAPSMEPPRDPFAATARGVHGARPRGPAAAPREAEDAETAEERRLAARARDEARWTELEAKIAQSDSMNLKEVNIPWPSGPKENPLRIDSNGHPKVVRSQLRAGLLRWHPDKFEQKFGQLLGEERRSILGRVKALAQQLTAQMAGLSTPPGQDA